MPINVAHLLDKMTPEEQAEVASFAAFILARRRIKKEKILTDDIQTKELLKLIEDSGSFSWLNSEKEDKYSIDDGEKVEWPSKS